MANASEGPDSETRNSPVEVREVWCKGCGFCVQVCPKEVLTMDGPKVVIDKPEKCTGCGLCVWICPDFAINVERPAVQNKAAQKEGGAQ